MSTQPVVLDAQDFVDMPPTLQRMAGDAQFATSSSPSNGSNDGAPPIASVEQGSPNKVSVEDVSRFRSAEPQLVAHEATHLWQNNLPPTVQAQIPEDDPNHPYNINDVDDLRKSGKTLAQLPREKAAAIVQNYMARPDQRQRLQPWIDDLSKTALSTIMPTAPDAAEINTHPRAPSPPPDLHEDDLHNPPPAKSAKKTRKQ